MDGSGIFELQSLAERVGDAEVYRFDLTPTPSEADWRVLSAQERARAERFRQPCDRRRYVLSHAHLRRLLARTCGEPAERLTIVSEPGGRPWLRDRPDLSFSLSRSGDLCAVALARNAVGVDIERLDAGFADPALEARFLHPAERGYLETRSGAVRAFAFLRFWTQKEAVTKALGLGLSLDLRLFATSPRGGRVSFEPRLDGGRWPRWRTWLPDAAPDCVVAVATPG